MKIGNYVKCDNKVLIGIDKTDREVVNLSQIRNFTKNNTNVCISNGGKGSE